jgi:hypothetical protein
MWPHQLIVNDRHDIKCVLFIFCTIGFKPNFQLLTEAVKSTERRVTFFCDNKDNHLLMDLIQHYVPWSNIKNICFCTIQHRHSLLIENFIRQNRLGRCDIYSYQQLELDRTTFTENSKNITSSHLLTGNYFIFLKN